jgi:hypothetical protein
MSKCLIVDEDELCVPFAKSPIDEYRGTGKKLVRTEFVQSTNCKYRCMGWHMTGSCCCEDRYGKLMIRLNEVREILKNYDGNQSVTFGKYKGNRWCIMLICRESKSWCQWYIKNCTNKGDFYEYLVLLKEEEELMDSLTRINNPNYD